jgi:tetratricopeptide (TPR) repeat protein
LKNQILAASLLFVAACQKPSSPTPPPRAPLAAVKPAVVVAPVVAEVIPATPEPSEEVEVKLEPDLLGLPHEHLRAGDHLARADELRTTGDLAAALVELRYAAHDMPADEEVLDQLGRVAKLSREPKLAAVAYGRLAELLPDDAVPLLQLARIQLALGDREGALSSATGAVDRDPENPEGYQLLGRVYLAQKDLAQAIAQFERAVHLDPLHGHALNNLGYALLQANQNDRAVDILLRATEALPHVAYVHNNLGVALERTGEREAARLAYARSSDLSPRYVKAKLNADRLARVDAPESMREEPGPDAAESGVDTSELVPAE